MTAVATTLSTLPVRTTRVRGDRRTASAAPVPRGPRLHPRRGGVFAGASTLTHPTSVRACRVEVAPAAALGDRVQLTERGLAVVLGAFACLALMTLVVVVNAFLSFSNAPLA